MTIDTKLRYASYFWAEKTGSNPSLWIRVQRQPNGAYRATITLDRFDAVRLAEATAPAPLAALEKAKAVYKRTHTGPMQRGEMLTSQRIMAAVEQARIDRARQIRRAGRWVARHWLQMALATLWALIVVAVAVLYFPWAVP